MTETSFKPRREGCPLNSAVEPAICVVAESSSEGGDGFLADFQNYYLYALGECARTCTDECIAGKVISTYHVEDGVNPHPRIIQEPNVAI